LNLDWSENGEGFSITATDNEFLQSVKSKIPIARDYKLDKVDNVIQKLSIEHFKDDYILNYDLVDSLLENSSKNGPKVSTFVDYLLNKRKDGIKFLYDYKDNGMQVEKLVQLLSEKGRDLWKSIESETEFSSSMKDELCFLILNNVNLDDLNELSKSSNLNRYLSAKKEPLTYFFNLKSIEKSKEIISKLKLKFESLGNPSGSSKELFEYIKSNNFYVLNKRNIDFMILEENKRISQKQLDTQNYTTIVNSNSSPLKKYVEENISNYVDELLLKRPENDNENQTELIKLLNSPDLLYEQKVKLIRQYSNKLDSIVAINESEIKAEFFNQDKISPSWENVVSYLSGIKVEELDEILLNYLNKQQVYEKLSRNNLSTSTLDQDKKEKISLAIIYNDDLLIEAYTALLTGILQKWKGLNLSKISKEKVNKMVDIGFLDFTVEYYDELKDNFQDLHLSYLENNFEAFLQSDKEFELNDEEITSLLESTKVKENYKMKYVRELDEYEITKSKNLGAKVTQLISKNDYGALSFSFISGLFDCSNSNEDRIRLFNNQIEYLSMEETKSLVSQLNYPFSNLVVPRKRTTLKATQINIDFSKNLKDKDVVSSVKVSKQKIKVVAKYS